MLEYVFFHQRPCELFVSFLKEKGLVPEMAEAEGMYGGTYEVRLPEDISDDLSDAIEAEYDRLLDMNQELIEQDSCDANELNRVGVVVHLKDGSVSYADMDPKLVNRIMEVITPDELNLFINSIVDAVENPDPRSPCQRQRENSPHG